MTNQILTQSRLKSLLHYCPDTGDLTWTKSRHGVKVGSIAGYTHHTGYIMLSIDSKRYLAHRLAFLYMTGEFPENHTDHINHVRSDNRWLNLRKATRQENQKNRSIFKNNTSGHVGVSWCNRSKKWLVQININNKNTFIGHFTDIKEAIFSRWLAEDEHGYHKNHGC